MHDAGRRGLNRDMVFLADTDAQHSRITIGEKVYTVVKHLGSGTYGMVGVVKDTDGQLFVLKRVLVAAGRGVDELAVRNVVQEAIIHHIINLTHADLAPMLYMVGATKSSVYMLMANINGTDVSQMFDECTSTEDRYFVFRGAMCSFAGMSKMLYSAYNFTHGDLKPDNLFAEDVVGPDGETTTHIRMIDFGFASLRLGSKVIRAGNPAGNNYHPTMDLSMLAISFVCDPLLESAKARNILDVLLRHAVCDTSTSEIRGSLRYHPMHATSLIDMEWRDTYEYFQLHDNIRCMPDAVLSYFEQIDNPDAIHSNSNSNSKSNSNSNGKRGGRRTRKVLQIKRLINPSLLTSES